jgi:hypothetical protein
LRYREKASGVGAGKNEKAIGTPISSSIGLLPDKAAVFQEEKEK